MKLYIVFDPKVRNRYMPCWVFTDRKFRWLDAKESSTRSGGDTTIFQAWEKHRFIVFPAPPLVYALFGETC